MARELPLEPYPVPRHHATLRALGRRIHFGRLALHLPDGWVFTVWRLTVRVVAPLGLTAVLAANLV